MAGHDGSLEESGEGFDRDKSETIVFRLERGESCGSGLGTVSTNGAIRVASTETRRNPKEPEESERLVRVSDAPSMMDGPHIILYIVYCIVWYGTYDTMVLVIVPCAGVKKHTDLFLKPPFFICCQSWCIFVSWFANPPAHLSTLSRLASVSTHFTRFHLSMYGSSQRPALWAVLHFFSLWHM